MSEEIVLCEEQKKDKRFKMNELISIIVPVYNVRQYLEKCVNNLIHQTHKNLEIILVDDGSEDGSGALCDALEKQDERIVVIHKKNGGLADARNAGIKVAHGSYIGFVDSDDWVDKSMYEKLLAACLQYDADIACCGRFLYYNSNFIKKSNSNGKIEVWNSEESIKRLLTWNEIDSAAWDKLYKAEIWKEFSFPFGKLHEDIYVMPQILDYSDKIVHVGEPLYYYRQRIDGITRSKYSKKKMDLYEAIINVENFIELKYPSLLLHEDAFFVTNIDVILYLMMHDKKTILENKSDYDILTKELRSRWGKCLKNKHMSFREKIKLVLVLLKIPNIYTIFKEHYLKLKAIK